MKRRVEELEQGYDKNVKDKLHTEEEARRVNSSLRNNEDEVRKLEREITKVKVELGSKDSEGERTCERKRSGTLKNRFIYKNDNITLSEATIPVYGPLS